MHSYVKANSGNGHLNVKWHSKRPKNSSFHSVLTHYDPQLPILLAFFTLWRRQSHLPIPQERHIAFASRTLNKAEQNYAQIERESLGMVFGVVNSTIIYMAGSLLSLLIIAH